MFELNEVVLRKLFELNHFVWPGDEMFFFGIRGALAQDENDHSYRKSHQLEVQNVDYLHPRCTIGQWQRNVGIALFPGSTVPHTKNVQKALASNGSGANLLLTGLYKDYRKGWHKPGKPTGHEAFRQDGNLPVRRTADDLDFDEDDRVEYMRPNDNLHAAWCMSIDQPGFASAGCQVIVGYPQCEQRDNAPNAGPWKYFKDNAYAIDQDSFEYLLLPGSYVRRVALDTDSSSLHRLRFGSNGQMVTQLQAALKEQAFYDGSLDGSFGPGTLFALLGYQTARFGADADDGVVGPITAETLNLTL